MDLVIVRNELLFGSYAEKINMSHFGINLGQTAEDSEMFTNIWLSSKGLTESTVVRSRASGIVGSTRELTAKIH